MNETTDQTDKLIFGAFVRAQRKFGKALKSATNPHFRSKYADLSACIEAVIDSLHSEGFALTQYTEPDEGGVRIRTVLLHESGGLLTLGELSMPVVKNDPQGFGSALTYCRRYSLLAAMGLAPEDDDGNAASKPVVKTSATAGEFDKLPTARQSMIVDVIEAIKERLSANDIVGAYGEYSAVTEVEEKMAMWSKLDSKTRAVIKSHGETLKGAK
jgi:hypothetical protein